LFKTQLKIMRLRSLSYDASQCEGNDVTVLWLRVPQWSVMVDKPSVHFFIPFKSRHSPLSLKCRPVFCWGLPLEVRRMRD